MILLTPLIIIYFASIAETTKKHKISTYTFLYTFYIHFLHTSLVFLQPTDKEEITNITSCLNFNKAYDPKSTPYRILFLLKMKFQHNWQIYSTSPS